MLKSVRYLPQLAICAALSMASPVHASQQSTSVPNPVIYTQTLTIEAGGTDAESSLPAIPAGKYFVGQTISFYVQDAAPGTSFNGFVSTKLGNKVGFIATGVVQANGPQSIGATTSATFYVASGQNLSLFFYRSPSATTAQQVMVTIVGYFVDGPPSA